MRTIVQKLTTIEPMSFFLGIAIGVITISFILIWAVNKRRGE